MTEPRAAPQMTTENNYAHDALCPKCRKYQEIIWTKIEILELHGDGQSGTFRGLEMRCRICDFVITNVGNVGAKIGAVDR